MNMSDENVTSSNIEAKETFQRIIKLISKRVVSNAQKLRSSISIDAVELIFPKTETKEPVQVAKYLQEVYDIM